MGGYLLEVKDITKRFGKVTALNKVRFDVKPNEIHVLCVENGAGKSTLMNVLGGIYPKGSYEGEFSFEGEAVSYTHLLNKKSVDDINVSGKKVLVRCDFNVPLKEGKITDENRLVAALPTIKKLVADGGRVILCSHLGKPKGEPKPELSLAPVAVRLSELLGQEVKFVASPVVVDDSVKAAVEAMKDGEIILLENTRYRAEETKNGRCV